MYEASENEYVERQRKRPTTTQPRARQIKQMFGSEHVKRVSIPAVGAIYNDKMGAVDIGDQLKESLGMDHRICKGGWQAIAWNFLLETVLVNSFLLQLRSLPNDRKTTSQRKWRYQIMMDLLHENATASKSRKRLRPGDEFTPYSQHKHVKRGKEGPCLGCIGLTVGQQRSKKPRRALEPLGDDTLNRRSGRKRGKKTPWGCNVCDVALCTSEQCWYLYHHPIIVDS